MSGTLLDVVVRRKMFAGARTPVLRDVALSLGPGEIVALLGPSGCGKTTLLRIVAGLDRDFSGTLAWRAGSPPRLGIVFQQPLLLPWRTVRRNLRLVLPRADMLAPAEELLAALGLGDVLDAAPASLSLGMARRVAIARALAIEPELLLLDEPFVSLDAAAAGLARTVVLAAWRARPTAILLVTHDVAEAAALADRVLLLAPDPGRVVAEMVIAEADRRTGAAAVVAAILRAREAAALDRPGALAGSRGFE
jgi:NitT/TauT family transport system ATP-binding protein